MNAGGVVWMTKDRQQDLRERVTDYKRFSIVTMLVTIFLFIGLIIPSEHQYSSILFAGIFLGTISSFLFIQKSSYYQKLLDENK